MAWSGLDDNAIYAYDKHILDNNDAIGHPYGSWGLGIGESVTFWGSGIWVRVGFAHQSGYGAQPGVRFGADRLGLEPVVMLADQFVELAP